MPRKSATRAGWPPPILSSRQGASLDLRNKLFSRVISSPKVEEKGTNAGLYFLAFEFQLWSNLGHDARTGERERLMKDAVEEFFCHLLSLTHWTENDPFAGKNPLAFSEADRERAAFNAFALTLEKNNRKQELAYESTGRDQLLREDVRLRKAADVVIESAKAIPVEQAAAREALWTPEKGREEAVDSGESVGAPTEPGKLWTPGS